MSKPQRHGTLPPGSIATLPVRAVEALQEGRFKDAIELFKQLVRQDPTPEWTESLAEAYAGRAGTLAAKGMFKEAALVLENTLNGNKILREPALYVRCLIHEGQAAKAAAYLLHCASCHALPHSLEELTAALLLNLPQLPAPTGPLSSEEARWRDMATTAREAMAAWIDGASGETVEIKLARISLRSPFRPLRLLLKCLITQPVDLARTRALVESIGSQSPFYPLRTAVEVAISGAAVLDADTWARLSAAQQGFVAETGGLTATDLMTVGRLSEAARGGSGSLFTWLIKQNTLPAAELRSACFNLLPQLPDRLGQFEKAFGPLSLQEKLRIKALSAEAHGKWRDVEAAWSELARNYATADDRLARLSAGVIYRYLGRLVREHPELMGDDFDDPQIFYLERSSAADPDHLPTLLARLNHYRKQSRDKEWHALADQAAQRFPNDSEVLLAAMESSVARQAYKKASSFARRLLSIDPINTGVRRQMIDLAVAHARKQMRSKRPDLAAKELALAAEWDRPDAPNALLRIARGLVALRGGEAGQAKSWLHEGATLAGGGVAGWFRIVLEAELMKCTSAEIKPLKVALDQARREPPTRPAILAVATALGQPVTGQDKRILQSLLVSTHAWLRQGAEIDWTAEESQMLAETFTRLEEYRLLRDYATVACKREPGNLEWRFQHIVARTKGNSEAMTFGENVEVGEMLEAAVARNDFHARTRIARFLGIEQSRLSRQRQRDDHLDDLIDDVDPQDMVHLLRKMIDSMPREAVDRIHRLVTERGREAAIVQIFEDFRDSPLSDTIPGAMLRQLCQDMVDHAMAAPASKKRRFSDA